MSDTIEKFCIFAIRVITATSTSRSSENRKNFEKKENKLGNLLYLGYITAKFHEHIPSSYWDRFSSSEIEPNLRYVKNGSFLRFPKNFLLQPPSNFHGKQFLGCFTSVENLVTMDNR